MPVTETSVEKGKSGLSNPTVRPIILSLIAMGVVMLLITFWYVHSTKPQPDALDRLRTFRRTVR
ncbi:MAG: hypothetical protein AB7N61_26395 [Acidimicrobiia bacterium]